MVEILTVGSFVNHIGAVAHAKGYRSGNYRLMALILWCLGELIGLFGGLVLVSPSDPLSLFTIYLCALCGAAVGAGLAYGVVRSLKVEISAEGVLISNQNAYPAGDPVSLSAHM
jgi:hypothetical protein